MRAARGRGARQRSRKRIPCIFLQVIQIKGMFALLVAGPAAPSVGTRAAVNDETPAGDTISTFFVPKPGLFGATSYTPGQLDAVSAVVREGITTASYRRSTYRCAVACSTERSVAARFDSHSQRILSCSKILRAVGRGENYLVGERCRCRSVGLACTTRTARATEDGLPLSGSSRAETEIAPRAATGERWGSCEGLCQCAPESPAPSVVTGSFTAASPALLPLPRASRSLSLAPRSSESCLFV